MALNLCFVKQVELVWMESTTKWVVMNMEIFSRYYRTPWEVVFMHTLFLPEDQLCGDNTDNTSLSQESYIGLAHLVGASALDLQQADSYRCVSDPPLALGRTNNGTWSCELARFNDTIINLPRPYKGWSRRPSPRPSGCNGLLHGQTSL